MKNTVVIAVSSGIAAYKTKELIASLHQHNIHIEVIMTQHAAQMVSPSLFEKRIGKPVHQHLFPKNFHYQDIIQRQHVDHIDLADSAAVFVIAPATANTIAKLAHGIADNILTTTALAVTAPIIICPSMNVHMWTNPVTQENVAVLKRRGYIIIPPEVGSLACGYDGVGRLADLSIIQTEILKQLKRTQQLTGKRVVVTAGGTVEPIDDIRALTNKSSGKMGTAIAEACFLQGAAVTLLRAEQAVTPRYALETDTFTTAASLSEKLTAHVKTADIVFHAAAVSDFSMNKTPGKLSSSRGHTLTLEPQEKIIDRLKAINPNALIVGFKAEHNLSKGALIQKAQKRLESSRADIFIANDVSKSDRGFATDTNEVWVITRERPPFQIELATKNEVAESILDYLFSFFAK